VRRDDEETVGEGGEGGGDGDGDNDASSSGTRPRVSFRVPEAESHRQPAVREVFGCAAAEAHNTGG